MSIATSSFLRSSFLLTKRRNVLRPSLVKATRTTASIAPTLWAAEVLLKVVIPKLHELLHIANNIRLWGAHSNIHSGPPEHNHIANVKRPGKGTRKLKSKFDFQLASRMYEKKFDIKGFSRSFPSCQGCHDKRRGGRQCESGFQTV